MKAPSNTDGAIGSVSSFVVDGKSWKIRERIVETGHWYAGEKIPLLAENIGRIRYEASTVFVNLTKDDIAQTTRNDGVPAGAGRPRTIEWHRVSVAQHPMAPLAPSE